MTPKELKEFQDSLNFNQESKRIMSKDIKKESKGKEPKAKDNMKKDKAPGYKKGGMVEYGIPKGKK